MPRRPRPPAPCKYWSVQMEPAPKKIKANVPINSATSFCEMLYMEISSVRGKEDGNDSNGCILAAMRRETPARCRRAARTGPNRMTPREGRELTGPKKTFGIKTRRGGHGGEQSWR